MKRPVRVLYINGGALDYGGITAVMLNAASRFDPALVRVDFLVHGMEPGPREEEARALSARIYHVPQKSRDYFGNRRAILAACNAGYDVVHAHMDGMNGYALSLAKAAGVRARVSHSHNTQFLTTNPLRVRLHRAVARRIPAVATDLFACSERAGRFLYGDALVDAGKVRVVHNAIDLPAYGFDSAARARLRSEMGLCERFVVGHVGRFDYQKNQEFLLALLPELVKRRPEAVLAFVGDGPGRAEMERELTVAGLSAHVRFLGFRSDVAQLLSAFDAFALPSRFEGLGIVLIEAQRSGLPCIASDAVPRDTYVTDCSYLPLVPEPWLAALTCLQPVPCRAAGDAPFRLAGYGIETEAKKLQELYLEMARR